MSDRLEDKIAKMIWQSVKVGVAIARENPDKTDVEIADRIISQWHMIDAVIDVKRENE